LSEQLAPSVPMPTLMSAGEHSSHVSQPVAQPHVRARIVRHRGAAIAQPLHVLAVEPHAMGDGEALVDQAELVHMGGERPAVALVAGDDLDLGFGDVAVDCRHRTRARGCGRRSGSRRCSDAGWSAPRPSVTFSKGHFCSAFVICFVVAFQGS